MKSSSISIIIPVYNGETYISDCLNTIFTQVGDYEVLVINDGSSDNTLEILTNMAMKYKNLKIIDLVSNCGVSNARNVGIKNSVGKYIMFCDADDRYSLNTITSTISAIKQYNPDYIVFNRNDILEGEIIASYSDHSNIKLLDVSREDYIINYFANGVHTFIVNNKVYKKEIIENISLEFDEDVTLSEDTLFNLEYLFHATVFVENFETSYERIYRKGSTIYKPIKNFYYKNTEIIDNFLKKLIESNLRVNNIGSIEKKLYYHYGRVAIFRFIDHIDGENWYERIKGINIIFKDLKFQAALKSHLMPIRMREKIIHMCFIAKTPIIIYLLFSTFAKFKRISLKRMSILYTLKNFN